MFRRTERFAEGVKNLIVFTDWQTFRHYVADLLHMMYSAARVTLEADIRDETLGAKQLKRGAKMIAAQEKVTDYVLKSILKNEAHNLTIAIVNLSKFNSPEKMSPHMDRLFNGDL